MSKILLKLDVSKFDKSRIKDNTFTTQKGEVTQKLYDVEVVALKERKFIKELESTTLYKTHFVVQAKTKEERATKAADVYVGEGFTFEPKSTTGVQDTPVDDEDIPF